MKPYTENELKDLPSYLQLFDLAKSDNEDFYHECDKWFAGGVNLMEDDDEMGIRVKIKDLCKNELFLYTYAFEEEQTISNVSQYIDHMWRLHYAKLGQYFSGDTLIIVFYKKVDLKKMIVDFLTKFTNKIHEIPERYLTDAQKHEHLTDRTLSKLGF